MNICEHTILEILRNNILFNGEIVPVIVSKRFKDTTPSITIETTTTNPVSERYSDVWLLPLISSHPLFDGTDPEKLYAQEVIVTEEQATMRVNVWANTEKERQDIKDEVKHLINQALAFHYKYCTNFNKKTEICNTTNEKCKVIDNISSLAVKGNCIEPEKYQYESILKKNKIKNGTVEIYAEYDQDNYDLNPPILRTVLKMKMTYYDSYQKGGYETEEFNVEMDV